MGAVILSVSVPVVLSIVLPIVALIAGIVAGFAIYHFVLKNKTDRSKKFANKMVEEAIAEADEKAHALLADEPRGMGFCFLYWNTKANVLSEYYGIEWRSPAIMNPGVMFD